MNLLKAISYLVVIGLFACTSSNVLSYRNKEHYSEYNHFYTYDKSLTVNCPLTLVQSIVYDRPEMMDEEHVYHLGIEFLDSTAAKIKGC